MMTFSRYRKYNHYYSTHDKVLYTLRIFICIYLLFYIIVFIKINIYTYIELHYIFLLINKNKVINKI